MPHVKDKNLELGTELSSAVFWRAKKVFVAVVWGEMFATHFCKFFKKIMKKDNGDLSSEPLSIPDGTVMTTKPSTLIRLFIQPLVKSFVLFLTSFMQRVVLKRSRNPSIGWWKSRKWKADRQSVS
jgi:hypothetical protein